MRCRPLERAAAAMPPDGRARASEAGRALSIDDRGGSRALDADECDALGIPLDGAKSEPRLKSRPPDVPGGDPLVPDFSSRRWRCSRHWLSSRAASRPRSRRPRRVPRAGSAQHSTSAAGEPAAAAAARERSARRGAPRRARARGPAPRPASPSARRPVDRAPRPRARRRAARPSRSPRATCTPYDDLRDLLPDTVGGVALAKTLTTGEEFRGVPAERLRSDARAAQGPRARRKDLRWRSRATRPAART